MNNYQQIMIKLTRCFVELKSLVTHAVHVNYY